MFDRIAAILGLDDFDKRHKVAFVLLIVAMIGVVTLWVIQLRRNITNPLYANLTGGAESQNNLTQETGEDAALRNKDTDTDGLNDWDELNLYKTSPYLADSDSDTFGDKQEVDSGNDPNCPQGQTCAAESSDQSEATPSDFSNPGFENFLNPTVSGTTTISGTVTPSGSSGASNSSLSQQEKDALKQAFGNAPEPQALRAFLLQAGMDKTTLDGLSDAQIVATFNEMIK